MNAIFLFDSLNITLALAVVSIFLIVQLYTAGTRDHVISVNLLMLFTLVTLLSGNLILLLFAWQGISLMAFVLYSEKNNDTVHTSLLINLSGDLAVFTAFILMYLNCGRVEFMQLASRINTIPVSIITVIGLLLIFGISVKAGLAPFFTWVASADKRPLTITALLVAAGPVVAGVYLLCRFHFIFSVSAVAASVITLLGITSFLAGTAVAICQTDIRRSISYLAAGQTGLLFLAAGCQVYPALVSGYLVYALVMTLLLLSADLCTRAVRNHYDVFHLGGLMKHLDAPFWSFLIATLLIAGIPFFYATRIFITLWRQNHYLIFTAGLIGLFLSAVAVFRLLILVFFTAEKFDRQTRSQLQKPNRLTVGILTALAAAALLISIFFPFIGFDRFIDQTCPAATITISVLTRIFLYLMLLGSGLAGMIIAFLVYQKNTWPASRFTATFPKLHTFCCRGFFLDELLSAFIIRPFQCGCGLMRKYLDEILLETIAVNGTGFAVKITGLAANLLQTGHIRHYLLFMLIVIIVILMAVR